MDTKKLLPSNEYQYSTEAKEYMNMLLASFVQNIMKSTKGKNILHNIESLLPEYIASGAKYAVEESIKHKKPVISIDKLLQTKDISKEDKRDLSYLLQYITSEVLDLATNNCREDKKKRISKYHVENVIRHDIELRMIFELKSPSPRSRRSKK